MSPFERVIDAVMTHRRGANSWSVSIVCECGFRAKNDLDLSVHIAEVIDRIYKESA